MQAFTQYRALILPFLFSLTLAACGGGSGGGGDDSGGGNPPANNSMPTVNAGKDQAVDAGASVILTASASDSDGTIASYHWRQIAGTSVVLSGADSARATFTAPDVSADETLSFSITVTDDSGATATSTIAIRLSYVSKNTPPTVNAGPDQTVYEQSVVTLIGTAKDSDGVIARHLWEQVSGLPVVLVNYDQLATTFDAPELDTPEMLEFQLTVSDESGASSRDTVMVRVHPFGQLNDTGITTCADESTNNLDCPVPGYGMQDAEHGRDVSNKDDSDGYAGFSFTKLDASGKPLSASVTQWSCVQDNVTGLVWEVKTTTGGLQDKDNTYSWYNPDSNSNGGDAGTQDGGNCSDSACDTHAYIESVNQQGLCGVSNWRLPNYEELRSIVSFDGYGLANQSLIDNRYFPNTQANPNWSCMLRLNPITRFALNRSLILA